MTIEGFEPKKDIGTNANMLFYETIMYFIILPHFIVNFIMNVL